MRAQAGAPDGPLDYLFPGADVHALRSHELGRILRAAGRVATAGSHRLQQWMHGLLTHAGGAAAKPNAMRMTDRSHFELASAARR